MTTNRISTTLTDEIRGYERIEREIHTLEEQLDNLKRTLRHAEERVLDRFMESDLDSVTYNGRKWAPEIVPRIKPASGQSDACVAAIAAHGGSDLVVPTMHFKRRDAFLRETCLRDDGVVVVPEWLDGLVEVFEQPVLTKRKA